MKKLLMQTASMLLFYLGAQAVYAQVGIGTATPDPSAILDLTATDKGFLLPRMTTLQMSSITSPAEGLMIYNITDSCIYFRRSGSWRSVCGGSSSGATWNTTGNTSSTSDFLGTTNNISLRFRTNNTPRMVIDSTGNVGIGTLAPGATLNTYGSLRFENLSSTTSFTNILVTNTAGDVNVRSAQSLTGAFAWSLIGNTLTSTGNFLGTSNNMSLRFRTNNMQRMVIDSIGNFGVGTYTPTATLHTNGSLRFEGLSSSTKDSVLVVDGQGNVTFRSASTIGGSGGGSGWGLTGNALTSTSQFMGTTNNYSVRFRSNNTERMIIDSTGNIGIGVSAPTQKLHVYGGVRFETLPTTSSQTNVVVAASNGDLYTRTFSSLLGGFAWGLTGNNLSSPAYFFGTTNNLGLRIRTNNIQRMTVDSLGNVGINTLNPTAIFHTNGSARFEGLSQSTKDTIVVMDGQGNLSYRLASTLISASGWGLTGNTLTSNSQFMGTVNNYAVRTRVNNTERMVIDTTGYVGIGVTSPTALLHTNGTVRFENMTNVGSTTNILAIDGNGYVNRIAVSNILNGNQWSLTGNSITTANYIGSSNNASVRFRSNNTERMIIDSTGKVGIGTSTPTAALHINASSNPLRVEGLMSSNQDTLLVVDGSGYVYKRALSSISGIGGGSGTSWSLTGNAGTSASTNYLGTSDSVDLVFRTNNRESARFNAWKHSFYGGDNTTASATNAFGWGYNTTISGNYSAGFGYNNRLLSAYSFIAGNGNVVESAADYSATFGTSHTVKYTAFKSFTTGESNLVEGAFANAMGYNLRANSYGMTVVGQFNDTVSGNRTGIDSTNHLFVVANGSVTCDRSNVITATWGGKVGIANKAPQTALDVNGGLTIREDNTYLVNSSSFTLTVGNRSYFRVNSNNVPGSRVLTLTDGLRVGQIIIIECTASTPTTGFRVADSPITNNTQTSGNRDLELGDTIMMIWNGVDWVEVSYSDN